MKLNLRRAAMKNNFLEAFENSNALQENVIKDVASTIKSNIQVNKQNKANAEKQNAANVNADVANKNGYQQIIASLQKIANEQVQFDEKSIDVFIKNINNLKSLDDKSKKQINQMLNQQKAALQQAAAQTNQGEAAHTTEQPTQQPEQNAANTQQGDANNIANNAKAKPTVDAINRGLSSGLSVDDLIAYLQTLKK